MNRLAAEGWALVTFTAGYSEGPDHPGPTGDPVFIALFQRFGYNPYVHKEALAELSEQKARHGKMRMEIENVV